MAEAEAPERGVLENDKQGWFFENTQAGRP